MMTMKMPNRRLSQSLLGELYDLEEDAYRLSLREATRIGSWSPGLALQPAVGHTGQTLEELPAMARARDAGVVVGSSRRRLEAFRRVYDRVIDQIIDHEQGYRRTLTALRKSIDVVRVIHAAAIEECDPSLSSWCEHWLCMREALVTRASNELTWFGQHPLFARARLAAAAHPHTPLARDHELTPATVRSHSTFDVCEAA